jgi:hypothetical protein
MSPPNRGLAIRSAQCGQAAHRQIHLVRRIVLRRFSAAATAHIGLILARIPSSPLGARGVSFVCYWQEQTYPR